MPRTAKHSKPVSRLKQSYRPLIETLEERIVLTNDFYKVPGVLGEIVQLQFDLNGKASGANNELGIYLVDDTQGRVNGLLPSQVGYATAVASRAQLVFSKTATVGSNLEITTQAGQQFGFLLVKKGSLEQWSQSNPDNLPGQTPLLLFSVDAANPQKRDAVKTSTLSGDATQVKWEDSTTASSRLFNDNSFVIKPLRDPVLHIPGQAGQTVTMNFTLAGRYAGMRNELGYYIADDAQGAINGVMPADANYAHAAITSASRQVIFSKTQAVGLSKRITLPSGSNVVFYMVQNTTTADFLIKNPNNERNHGPMVFFSLGTANLDQFNHQKWFNFRSFGFEDLYGGGDRDFNDILVRFTMDNPKGPVTPPETNPPVINATLRLDTAPGGTNSDAITSVADVQGTVADQSHITTFRAALDGSNQFTSVLARLNANGTFLLDRALSTRLLGARLPRDRIRSNCRQSISTTTPLQFSRCHLFSTLKSLSMSTWQQPPIHPL